MPNAVQVSLSFFLIIMTWSMKKTSNPLKLQIMWQVTKDEEFLTWMGVLILIMHKGLSAGSRHHQPARLTWIVLSTLMGNDVARAIQDQPPFHLVATP